MSKELQARIKKIGEQLVEIGKDNTNEEEKA